MCADQLTRRDFVKVAALGIGGTSTSRQDINARTASFRQSEPQSAGEPFDVERARRDTPGTRQVVHLNHAGASLMPRPVLDAVQAHLNLEAEIGGMEAAEVHAAELKRTYDAVARLVGCDGDEIALVENTVLRYDLYAAVCGQAETDRRRNCVRPSNVVRSLTGFLSALL
jgi:hypothetical protein